jgi:hypothetical protein
VLDTDYALVLCAAGAGSNASTAPVGYTTVQADTVIGSNRFAAYGAIIGSATTITLSYPSAPGTGNNTAVLVAFFAGTTGAGVTSTLTAPSVAGFTAPCLGLTTPGPDRLVLAIGYNKGTGSGFPSVASFAPTATLTAARYASANFYPSIAIGSFNQSAAATTADQTVTWDFSTVSQAGMQIALTPSVVDLSASVALSPTNGDIGYTVGATVTAAGGTGTPKTYAFNWGCGHTTPAQSSNVASHLTHTAGTFTCTATVLNT